MTNNNNGNNDRHNKKQSSNTTTIASNNNNNSNKRQREKLCLHKKEDSVFKSFFGRSYNNLSSITDCKNNGECIINKKNRTACKACRLRKCLLVGMSKSGSRYGRRSNWFKIHCLLQEQQQQAAAAMAAAVHHNSQHQQHHLQQQQHQQQHQQQQHQQHQHQHQQHPHPNLLPHQAQLSQQGSGGGSGVGGAYQPALSGLHHSPGSKPPPSVHPNSAAAAAALGMLGHAGSYPGLYPPRTKEELMMLGLEEYGKHAAAAAAVAAAAAASPCVSSPDSHNSDNSVEVSARHNPLLHLSKHAPDVAATPPHLRKETLHAFMPLPFPGLASMPVMPPPSFLPPSHLLFPGYHPALYSHHQGLLKPSPEQQQQAVAAAAAVQQLFNSSSMSPATRFTPTLSSTAHSSSPKLNNHIELVAESSGRPLSRGIGSVGGGVDQRPVLNNSHQQPQSQSQSQQQPQHQQQPNIANGNKAAEEITKRFYLDAVLKSQRPQSPPPSATKLPPRSTHDHSISALVTPNSESGRDRLTSAQSHEEEEDDEEAEEVEMEMEMEMEEGACAVEPGVCDTADRRINALKPASECGDDEDLVVSMTPPHSPAAARTSDAATFVATPTLAATTSQQDNPIDLSIRTCSERSVSARSSLSSKSSTPSFGGEERISSNDSESLEAETEVDADGNEADRHSDSESGITANISIRNGSLKKEVSNNNNNNNNINSGSFCISYKNTNNNNNNNSTENDNSANNNNNNNNNNNEDTENCPFALKQQHAKRKVDDPNKLHVIDRDRRLEVKRFKMDYVTATAPTTITTTPGTTPLDLTTKV